MANAPRIKAAVAQIATILGDTEANLKKHLDIIDEARAGGVDLLLFPEMSLTGHNAGAETPDIAIERDDPIVHEIARASGAMCTVFGLVEEGLAAQFHNTAIAVRDGATLFIHRKINLATYGALEEGKHFSHGRYVETFELAPYWRASILICADLWNPALVHLAAVHGSTILMSPISSALEAVGVEFDNPSGWQTTLRFYAMMYGLPVLMANRVGAEGALTFWGGSCIFGPFGKPLASAEDDAEQLLTAELDYGDLRRARFLLPTVRDSNLALIQREIERLSQIVGVPESVRET